MAQALQKRDGTGHKQKTFENESQCKEANCKKCKFERKKVFVLCDIRTSQFIHVCIHLMDGYTIFS